MTKLSFEEMNIKNGSVNFSASSDNKKQSVELYHLCIQVDNIWRGRINSAISYEQLFSDERISSTDIVAEALNFYWELKQEEILKHLIGEN